MKVVHVTPTYFSPESVVGGGERYPLEVGKAMGKYVETTVVSFGDEPEVRNLADNVLLKIYRRWAGDKLNPLNLGFLRELVDADVIHCHQFITVPTVMSTLVGASLGKRVFVTDLSAGGYSLAALLDLSHWTDKFLLLSQNSVNICRRFAAPKEIIGAGVDADFFHPTKPKEKKIIYVGRFIPNKGINYLIEAMPSDVQLNVIGNPYDERYYEYLQAQAKGKRVSFLVGLTDHQIVDEYSSALACVLPAVERSVFGNIEVNVQLFALPLVEAMACQTLPIGTNIFSMPEIVEDGATGFLVPPNDADALGERIAYVLDHPEEAIRMGRRGRETVIRRFTWDAVAKRCLKAYEAG